MVATCGQQLPCWTAQIENIFIITESSFGLLASLISYSHTPDLFPVFSQFSDDKAHPLEAGDLSVSCPGNARPSISDLKIWKAPARAEILDLGRGLIRGWKREWSLSTGFLLSPNHLLLPPGPPKWNPVFFHLVFKPCAGDAGKEKMTQSLPWRKKETDHHLPCDKDF